MKIFFFISLFIFTACSTKTPINNWQYQSVANYKSFERYYLEGKLELASVELDNARSYASQSADFIPLARIELSYCALRVAMLETYSCPKYEALKPFIHLKSLEAYSSFLSGTLKTENIKNLPSQYQEFASAQLQNTPQKMMQSLQKIKPLTSQMIAASLSKKYLNETIIESIIQSASFHGYKYALIQWLEFQLQQTNDTKAQKLILQKIKIIKN